MTLRQKFLNFNFYIFDEWLLNICSFKLYEIMEIIKNIRGGSKLCNNGYCYTKQKTTKFSISQSNVINMEIFLKDFSGTAFPRTLKFGKNIRYDELYCV